MVAADTPSTPVSSISGVFEVYDDGNGVIEPSRDMLPGDTG